MNFSPTKVDKVRSVLCLSAMLLTSGCRNSYLTPDVVAPPSPEQLAQERLQRFRDHLNGVWTYPNLSDFPQALSEFRATNSNIFKIMSVTQGPDLLKRESGAASTSYGISENFIILTEPIAR